VQQRMQLAAVDRRLEAVRGFEEVTELNRDADGALRRQRAGGENLREILAVEILHRDVDVTALGAVFVEHRNGPADSRERVLQLRAPALSLENLLGIPVRSNR